MGWCLDAVDLFSIIPIIGEHNIGSIGFLAYGGPEWSHQVLSVSLHRVTSQKVFVPSPQFKIPVATPVELSWLKLPSSLEHVQPMHFNHKFIIFYM